MTRNTYSFPTDPEPVGWDGAGAPIYAWADDDTCPDCADSPTGICRDCLASLRETDAGLDEADGRREG